MDTQAWLPKIAVLVNKAAFDALDKPSQAAAHQCDRLHHFCRRLGQQCGHLRHHRPPGCIA